MKILIATNSKSIRIMLQETLEKAGYEVVVAENGEQVFVAILKQDLRLIILDWEMPYIDGSEICRELARIKGADIVHVILLMGIKGTDNVVTALQAGASDYINKPFNTDELLTRVRVGERILSLQEQISRAERIDEHRRNEEELVKSEFKFRTVADFTWDWEFWMSPQRQFIYISPSCERITGYAASEFIERADLFLDIVYPGDCDHMQLEMENAFLQQTQTSIDFRIIHKDTTIRWVSMAYQPIKDSCGVFLGVRSFIRDITEHKHSEKEINLLRTITMLIAESENFYEALDVVLREVCNTTGWVYGEVWIPSSDGNYLECGPSWYSSAKDVDNFRRQSASYTFLPGIGLPGSAWLSKKTVWMNDVTLNPDFPRAPIAWECGFKAGVAIPVLYGDDVIAVMVFFISEQRDKHEQLTRIVSTVATQLGMFIQRKRMEGDIRQAHLQNKRLIAAIPSILIYVNKDDRISEWNKTAERVFGIASENVTMKPFSECGIQWNDRDVVKQILNCRNTNQLTRIDDIRFKKPDGEVGFLGITVNAVNDTAENQSTLLIVGSDITHRKTIESQLVQAQKLESIGQLAAGIAHEINTPTQYVGDNTRFLQDAFGDLQRLIDKYTELHKACKSGGATDNLTVEIDLAEKEADVEYLTEEIPKAIQQSLEGTECIAKIVRAMKEFSHPGTEGKTPIDINKAIECTITVARNEWKYVAKVVTLFDTSLPLVPCLPGEFNQVVLNLIINAAHAISDVVGKETGVKGIITITTSLSGNWAEIRINDTGTGIPVEIRSKIFDPFFTTKPVGKGTGQGLSIVHAIVVIKHGGTITFETEAGRGTTFIIRIPIESNYHERVN